VKTKIMVAAVIFVFLSVMSVYGQHPSLNAKIDFAFSVEGKVLPAGPYEFVRDTDATVFRIKGEGNNAALATIQTRLAGEMHKTPQDAHLVFDVIGGKYMLSEIWITGEDGYVLQVTKEKHEHKILNVNY
jgi:hypothetical protein